MPSRNGFLGINPVPGPVIGFPGPAIPTLGPNGFALLAALMAGAVCRRLQRRAGGRATSPIPAGTSSVPSPFGGTPHDLAR